MHVASIVANRPWAHALIITGQNRTCELGWFPLGKSQLCPQYFILLASTLPFQQKMSD